MQLNNLVGNSQPNIRISGAPAIPLLTVTTTRPQSQQQPAAIKSSNSLRNVTGTAQPVINLPQPRVPLPLPLPSTQASRRNVTFAENGGVVLNLPTSVTQPQAVSIPPPSVIQSRTAMPLLPAQNLQQVMNPIGVTKSSPRDSVRVVDSDTDATIISEPQNPILVVVPPKQVGPSNLTIANVSTLPQTQKPPSTPSVATAATEVRTDIEVEVPDKVSELSVMSGEYRSSPNAEYQPPAIPIHILQTFAESVMEYWGRFLKAHNVFADTDADLFKIPTQDIIDCNTAALGIKQLAQQVRSVPRQEVARYLKRSTWSDLATIEALKKYFALTKSNSRIMPVSKVFFRAFKVIVHRPEMLSQYIGHLCLAFYDEPTVPQIFPYILNSNGTLEIIGVQNCHPVFTSADPRKGRHRRVTDLGAPVVVKVDGQMKEVLVRTLTEGDSPK